MATVNTSPFDLTGERILISGAAGGIGSATARLCVEQGASLVLVDVVGEDQIRDRVGEKAAVRLKYTALTLGPDRT